MPAALWATGREVALVEDIRAAPLESPVGGVAHIGSLEAAALRVRCGLEQLHTKAK